MHGGGALILLALLACLPVAPPRAGVAPTGMTAVEATSSQESLASGGAPALRGTLRGACAGLVVVEARSAGEPVAATRIAPGPYVLRVPAGLPLELRWGCDPDGDGAVPAEAVASASVDAVRADVPLDLYLPDRAREARLALVTPASERPVAVATSGAPSPGAPPDPVAAAVLAPPDGAVGPPLPTGTALPGKDEKPVGPPLPAGTAPSRSE